LKRVLVAEERFFSERIPDREKHIFLEQNDACSDGTNVIEKKAKSVSLTRAIVLRTLYRQFFL
jgi:hypothetical protein